MTSPQDDLFVEDGRMTNSTLIARLMGPVLLFMGIGAVIGLLGKSALPSLILDVVAVG
jgi:hypothetical protein